MARVQARFFSGLMAACLTALAITGCSKDEPTTPTTSTAGGAGTPAVLPADTKVKIGYIVKQPEENWFQTEWKFADKAAQEDGFELVKLPGQDGQKVLSAIDDLATQGAQGVIICTPDVKLGPTIRDRAAKYNMKLITVDDQFLDADGMAMKDVHHLGVDARVVGGLAGDALAQVMKDRHWTAADTALCDVTHDELPTARDRTEGAVDALKKAGFPADRIFPAPQKTTDVPGSLNATNDLLTQHPDVKHWLICGMNDTAVIGAVRAMESHGFTADNVAGVGINGTEAVDEFKKPTVNGVYGSILMLASVHGHDTADNMYHWIKDGKEPPLYKATGGELITRDNYQKIMKDHGLLD